MRLLHRRQKVKSSSEALPYLTPVGAERIAAQAPSIVGRIAQGATRLLAENAVGSLAANSTKDDAEALATDLGVGVLAGGAINAVGRGLGAAYRGVRGAIAPEAQQAIRFAEREGLPSAHHRPVTTYFPCRKNGADDSRKYSTGWHKRSESNAAGSKKPVGAEIC